MFRKWIYSRIGLAGVLAITVSTFGFEAQAVGQQRERSAYRGYDSSAAYGNGSYDPTTVRGMFQARYAYRGRPRVRPSSAPLISDYGPHSQELDRQRSRPDVAGSMRPNTASRSSRDRMRKSERLLWNLYESDSGVLGSNSQSVNPAAASPPQSAFPAAPVFGGTNNAATDGGGALRGAGAPTNVDSPTESLNGRFRDEADAQSSKPPLHPGSPNTNR